MLELRIRPEARRDLRNVWQYTSNAWSAAQADRYVRKLNDAIAELCNRPEQGRACDEISPGLRRRSCERHVIFFRLAAIELIVVRVLHQSMDHIAQLSDEAP